MGALYDPKASGAALPALEPLRASQVADPRLDLARRFGSAPRCQAIKGKIHGRVASLEVEVERRLRAVQVDAFARAERIERAVDGAGAHVDALAPREEPRYRGGERRAGDGPVA